MPFDVVPRSISCHSHQCRYVRKKAFTSSTKFRRFLLAFPCDCMASHKRVHTTAASRLRQDYLRIVKDPVPYITALPLPSNILEWFVWFVLQAWAISSFGSSFTSLFFFFSYYLMLFSSIVNPWQALCRSRSREYALHRYRLLKTFKLQFRKI